MAAGEHERGLLEALRRVAAALIGATSTRLELARIELGEAQQRLVLVLTGAVAAGMLAIAALAAFSVWLALLAWDRLGPSVFAWLGLFYAALALGLFAWLRARLKGTPPLLGQTLAELRLDAARLTRSAPPGEQRATLP